LGEKSEEELIGVLVKLRKRESELSSKIDKIERLYEGPFRSALEPKYPDMNDPDRMFKARMSVSPDRIITLANELKALQEEYVDAHTATRDFEAAHPQTVKTLGTHYY